MRASTVIGSCCLLALGIAAPSCGILSPSASDDVSLPPVSPTEGSASQELQGSDSDIVMLSFTDSLAGQDLRQSCGAILSELDGAVDRAELLDAVALTADAVLTEMYLNLDAAVTSGLAVCDGSETLPDDSIDEIEAGLSLIAQRRSQLGLDS